MRALRTSLALAGLLGLAPSLAFGQVKKLLEFQPVVQRATVDYDRPSDPAAIEACKSEVTTKPPGYVLRDGQGRLLRRFVDSDRNGTLDQWSYFQDGFEVYREVDTDGDKAVDEARWMNSGGTRVAMVKTVGKRSNVIVGWKRISAEEASKVLVQAIVARDLELLETVMATPEDLASLGVPAAEVERVKAAAGSRAAAVDALTKGLAGWDKSTTWLQFNAPMPHLIPVDAAAGLKDDLTLYENAVILAGNGKDGQGDKTAFLQSTELVKVGNTWKFVDLPRAINPANQTPVVAVEGGLRSTIYRDAGTGGAAEDPALAAAIKILSDYDKANGANLGENKKQVARFHVGRVPLLRAIAKAATKPEDKLSYDKQVLDSIAAAYQTGQYNEGLKVLNLVEAEGGKLGSYAAYRRITADFALDNDSDSNMVAVQKKWMNNLKAFLDKWPNAEETPDVLLQLASTHEFNAEEKEAREFYTKLSESFPESPQGKKAAGAIRRLELVGKALTLKGKGADGNLIDTAQYRGKTLLVVFWATWAGPVKRDLPELAKIYEKNKAKGFEVVGVCLDNEKADLDAFLKANNVPWPQAFEPGGMEGRLATEFGIISLPTMFLVDPDGKVINRNIRTAADLDIQLDKALSAKAGPGVALGGSN
jgi:thiol-disulfide isomerase/thioredoxin